MKIDSQAGGASGENPDNEFNKLVQAAWSNLFAAIRHRDESMVTPEVRRVAQALCVANGGNIDALVHYAEPHWASGMNKPAFWLIPSNVCMSWTRYIGQATCAIANLEAFRDEELAKRKAEEEAANVERRLGRTEAEAGADFPVGFSGMNKAPLPHTDSLSHGDLAAMVEFLAAVFDLGPDGDTGICRQTGEPFHTVAIGWEWNKTTAADDQSARKILIRNATKVIMDHAKEGQNTMYWRVRPMIEESKNGLHFRARVAFGP